MSAKRSNPKAQYRDPFRFEVGQPLEPGSQYLIQDKDGDRVRKNRKRARPIGSGGAGLVYRVKYRGMDRALKILWPEKITGNRSPTLHRGLFQETLAQFRRTFDAEIRNLLAITHTNIAKIIDFGECKKPSGSAYGCPYYAMHYIPGRHFLEGIRDLGDEDCSPLQLFYDILKALVFLHEHQIVHCDVKEENLLVNSSGNRSQVTLVDLGVALNVPAEEAEQEQTAYFFSTSKITRIDRAGLIGTKVTSTFIREDLYPDQDLYAFGCLLTRCLEDGDIAEMFARRLGERVVSAMRLIEGRLTGKAECQYGSAQEVLEVLHRLDVEYMAPMGIAELSTSGHTHKALAMPGLRIRLTDRISDIVNAAAFQRLRNLAQLNYVYMLFPGARHSRFAHSLHAYHLCRDYIAHFLDDPNFRLVMPKAGVQASLLLALLHDVGHYPLSHMFEDSCQEQDSVGAIRTVWNDEELLACILMPESIKEEDGNLRLLADRLNGGIERQVAGPYGMALHKLLEAYGEETAAHLKEAVLKTGNGDTSYLIRGLIDCPIDVDKVAYLSMDSLMTGVEYGRGLDLDGLLSGLRCPKDLEQPSLAVSDKGLSAAEGVILARYWMIKRVYWHHANRSIMSMVKSLASQLLKSGVLDFQDYLDAVWLYTDTEALKYLVALWDQNRATIEEMRGGRLVNPVAGLLGGERRMYRRLYTISRRGPASSPELYNGIFQRVLSRGTEYLWGLSAKIEKRIGRVLGATEALGIGSVLIDVPSKMRERAGGRLFVVGSARDHKPEDIFDVSPILAGLAQEFDTHAKKCRILLCPSVYERLNESRKVGLARSAVEELLNSEVGS